MSTLREDRARPVHQAAGPRDTAIAEVRAYLDSMMVAYTVLRKEAADRPAGR
jgi:hypothetical protein